jgi:hypothetical protein
VRHVVLGISGFLTAKNAKKIAAKSAKKITLRAQRMSQRNALRKSRKQRRENLTEAAGKTAKAWPIQIQLRSRFDFTGSNDVGVLVVRHHARGPLL